MTNDMDNFPFKYSRSFLLFVSKSLVLESVVEHHLSVPQPGLLYLTERLDCQMESQVHSKDGNLQASEGANSAHIFCNICYFSKTTQNKSQQSEKGACDRQYFLTDPLQSGTQNPQIVSRRCWKGPKPEDFAKPGRCLKQNGRFAIHSAAVWPVLCNLLLGI